MRGPTSRYFAGNRSTHTSGGSIRWSSTETNQSNSGAFTSITASDRGRSSDLQHTVRLQLGRRGPDPVQQHADDVLRDELRNSPQEEAVGHGAAVVVPRNVERR